MALLVLHSTPVATSVYAPFCQGAIRQNCLSVEADCTLETYGTIQTLVEICAILEAEIVRRTERCKN